MFITHQVRKALNDLDERHNKLAALADEKGLKFGQYLKGGNGYGFCALSGNTFAVKDTLKANGAKFAGDSKVWYFETTEQAESALAAL